MKTKVSPAVIKRLPRYYRALEHLVKDNEKKVSSRDLAKMLDITASQVRQDFSTFGGFGQQGYGYDVEILKDELAKIIGLDKKYNMIVVGAGNIGKALARYNGFKYSGFNVIDSFDLDEKANEKIKPISTLTEEYVKENSVSIGIIATTLESAQIVADEMIKCGIKNIWNFAPIEINVPEDIIVENIFMSDSLFVLAYKMNEN